MSIEKRENSPQKMERFYTLQAGQYWKAKSDIIEQGIDANEVLLIESIRWVDDAAHTIILRPHPLKHGQQKTVDIESEDGSSKRVFINYNEHRFLLEDFLNSFDYEPDAESIRSQELVAVQAEIDSIKNELSDFSTNPDVADNIVKAALEAKAKGENGDKKFLPAVYGDNLAAEAATGSLSNALVGGVTPSQIEAMQRAANNQYEISTIKANWIGEKTKLIASTIRKMTPFYQEQAAAALAQTEDVRTYVAKIIQGIGSLDLYVGKDVEVFAISKGEDAPSDIPLTLVQSKLCMDEELSVFVDVNYRFDYTKVDIFHDTLRTNPELVNQIFPTERCVVVMVTTRRNIDYGNSFESFHKNEANKEVFLLVRNGENIYQVSSPVESHLKAAKLFPSLGDGDKIFHGYDGKQIKFDDIAFTDRLAIHEREAVHYKRFLILAAGLDHREKLFGHFYDETHALEFISEEFQQRYFNFIRDGDSASSLPKTKRQDLSSFFADKNKYFQAGSRIVSRWPEMMNPDSCPSSCELASTSTGYNLKYYPVNSVSMEVVRKGSDGLYVSIPVSGQTYAGKHKEFNCKIKIDLNNRYREEKDFLCLDNVSIDELKSYIHDRDTRRYHLDYIRQFKHAVKILEGEIKSEGAIRAKMKDELKHGNVSSEDAQRIIDDTISSWRSHAQWKSLPHYDGKTLPKQWSLLLTHMTHVASAGEQAKADFEAIIAKNQMQPLRVVASGDGKYVAYVAPSEDERDDRFEPFVWVHRIQFEKKHGILVEKSRKWSLLNECNASEVVLYEWDEARTWLNLSSDFSSPDEKNAVLGVISDPTNIEVFEDGLDESTFNMLLSAWMNKRSLVNQNGKFVQDISMCIPLGLVKTKSKTLCIGVESADMHAFLYNRAKTEELKRIIRDSYLRIYGRKDVAAKRFESEVNNRPEFGLTNFKLQSKLIQNAMLYSKDDREFRSYKRFNSVNPLLGYKIENFIKDEKAISFWFPDWVRDENGNYLIDALLSNELPEGYGPYHIIRFDAFDENRNRVPYGTFIDVSLDADLICKARENAERTFSRRSAMQITVATLREAKSHVQKKANEDGLKAVEASQMPGAPTPDEGVMRFYLVAP